jgi:hypothetical protein
MSPWLLLLHEMQGSIRIRRKKEIRLCPHFLLLKPSFSPLCAKQARPPLARVSFHVKTKERISLTKHAFLKDGHAQKVSVCVVERAL